MNSIHPGAHPDNSLPHDTAGAGGAESGVRPDDERGIDAKKREIAKLFGHCARYLLGYLRAAVSMAGSAAVVGLLCLASGTTGSSAASLFGLVLLAVIVINGIAIATAIVRYVWTGRREAMNEIEDRLSGQTNNDPVVMIALQSTVFLGVLYAIVRPI